MTRKESRRRNPGQRPHTRRSSKGKTFKAGKRKTFMFGDKVAVNLEEGVAQGVALGSVSGGKVKVKFEKTPSKFFSIKNVELI